MLQFLIGYLMGAADVARAAWHILTRQTRNTYATSLTIGAPRAAVWALLTRTDQSYESVSLRTITRRDPDDASILVSEIIQRDRQVGFIAHEELERRPGEVYEVRYLPERTAGNIALGLDDRCRFTLRDAAAGGTDLTIERQLTHSRIGTRLVAPISVRSTAYLVKQQAELEAGATQPATPSLWRQQWFAAPLAFASFVWLFGWQDALIVMPLIAIHEIGHALAMLYFGLGVSMISFIPFFGGLAAPKRYYETQWQKLIVLLMGVGFSLPVTAALYWSARTTGDPMLAKAAGLFAFINGANLLPIPMLDGGGAVAILLRRAPRLVPQAISGLMMAAFAGWAATMNDPILWVLVAMSAVAFLQMSALKLDDRQPPLPTGRGIVGTLLYLGLVAAYAALGWAALGLGDVDADT